MTFKANDKVRVIKPWYGLGLPLDSIHEVESYDPNYYTEHGGCIYVKNNSNNSGRGFTATRFELVATPIRVFDLTANISRQYLVDGRKVLSLVDTGADIVHPLAVVVEGVSSISTYTRSGQHVYGQDTPRALVTRPEQLPNEVVYVEYRRTTGGSKDLVAHTADRRGRNKPDPDEDTLTIVKTTFNPNDNTITHETIYNSLEK